MVAIVRGLLAAGCLLAARGALAVEPEPTPSERQEYVSTAPTRQVLKEALFAVPGKEVSVFEVTLPADDQYRAVTRGFAAAVLDDVPPRDGAEELLATADLVDRIRACARVIH